MGRKGAAGFTLVELVVVICIISVLAGVALGRLWELQEAAEAAAAEQHLSALKAAVLVRSGELAAANRWDELRRLPQDNPFLLLDELPADYAGEGAAPPPGAWSYFAAEHRVVYRPRHQATFSSPNGEMRFHLVALDGAGRLREGPGTAYVKLEADGAYRWQGRAFR